MNPELLFKHAFVIDGAGRPGFAADVAVTGGRIEAVGDLAGWNAARTVEARGLALAPGFVDMHGHSDYFLLILPSAEGKVKQGITTEVGGNCGYSAAPVQGSVAEDRKQSHKDLYNFDVDFETFDQFLSRMEQARPAINYAPLVGFNTVRASAGLYTALPPSPEKLAEMRAMVRAGMEAGAFGMSMGLIYPPGCFAGLDEIAACGREAAALGGIVSSHMRSEGDRVVEAVNESIAIARRAEARFQISHLKTSGTRNWGKLQRVFDAIEQARDQGVAITADRYPYLASFTQLSAALPEWVFEGGKEAFFARLADSAVRDKMRRELERTDEHGDRWDRIVISQVFHEELSRHEGQPVADAAKEAGMDPLDFVCDLTIRAKDRVAATYHTMSAGNLQRIYQKDWVMVGSDAAVRSHQGFLSEGKPHPRAYGTMPRMLGWVVREKGWLTLEAAVKKMTFDPCAVLGIKDRGVIREGMCADLVLFDPAAVRDTATYEKPQSYPEGIAMVVVNGKISVERGELTGERAGRVLRRGA
ncbi:MAG TPA: D-aminoacylase [bacterium]|nr:D-aminoacylase [bacterium]